MESKLIKVFVSGSISIKTLPQVAIEKLDLIMSKNFQILVGDANGVDSLIQQYLFNKKYSNVTVYHVGNYTRNNIGQWSTVSVDSQKLSGRAMYTQKDKQMALDSNFGLMIWDGKSKGTKANIEEMLALNKRFYVIQKDIINTDKQFVKENVVK